MNWKTFLKAKAFLKVLLMTSFGFVISLCLVPVLFPLFVVFAFITSVVVLFIKIEYGKTAFKANGTDVLSGKETDDSYPVINIAFRFQGKMNAKLFSDRIYDVAMNCYDKYGKRRYGRLMLLYRKCYGYNIWKDNPDFNIDQHIKVISKEELEPYDNADTEDGSNWEVLMKAILNKFGGERVQEGIPQWQLLLYKENEERYSAVFRFHHAIADGIYVSRMLVEEFLDSPTKLFHAYVPPSPFAKLIIKLWSFCLLPFGLWKILCNNDKNVLHGVKLTGVKRYFVSKPISLDLLRGVRMETGGTSIHAILFSCLSYSLASHFKRRNTETKEITTLIPVPMQNLSKPIELKNRYAVVSLKIPTSPVMINNEHNMQTVDAPTLDSLSRLNIIKSTLEEAKKDPTFIAVHSLITTFCSFLPAKVAESLLSTKGCSVAFSNLPGPPETIYFKKDRIDEVMFFIPDRSPMGIGMSILSYDNKIRAGLSVDKALITDDEEGELFVKDFENEVENIINSLKSEKEHLYNLKQENETLLRHLP